MVNPYMGSEKWVESVAVNGEIFTIDGTFYKVIPGPYGNPLILQEKPGDVFFTIVGEDMVLCEEEAVSDDGVHFHKEWRAVRRSPDNPDKVAGLEGAALGFGRSNSQRVLGPADKFYFVHLDENPDPNKYRLLSLSELARLRQAGSVHVFDAAVRQVSF